MLLARDQEPGTTKTLLDGTDGAGPVRRTVLPGGLRIITEAMPTVRSATFGIWAGVGSRDESPELAGATHYLEHLLFKGTERRSALEITAEIEAVGGDINAFTAKEYTCYYARVLDSDLPRAIDVISDMVCSSLITADDVERERDVILEEIAMHEDEPSDAVHDAFDRALLGDSPLGRPILGTVESIKTLSRGAIAGHYGLRYRPSNLVVAAAGNVDHETVVQLVKKAFTQAGTLGEDDELPEPPRIGRARVEAAGGIALVSRPTEQANVVLGVPGVSRTDERRFALGVLSSAVGGGMSSRLFQEIREKRGLAYSVYSYASHYADLGMFGVYAGCLPKKVDQVLDLCRSELQMVSEQGITDADLERGKGQMKGSLVLGLEDTGSRMSRIGKSELVYGELLSVDEILDRISSVTLEDIREIAGTVLTATPTLAVVGPFDQGHDFSAAVA